MICLFGDVYGFCHVKFNKLNHHLGKCCVGCKNIPYSKVVQTEGIDLELGNNTTFIVCMVIFYLPFVEFLRLISRSTQILCWSYGFWGASGFLKSTSLTQVAKKRGQRKMVRWHEMCEQWKKDPRVRVFFEDDKLPNYYWDHSKPF